jgi:hypothetical protein
MNYHCPECGKILVDGRDINGHCFCCPDCGYEGCDITDLILKESSDEENE